MNRCKDTLLKETIRLDVGYLDMMLQPALNEDEILDEKRGEKRDEYQEKI